VKRDQGRAKDSDGHTKRKPRQPAWGENEAQEKWTDCRPRENTGEQLSPPVSWREAKAGRGGGKNEGKGSVEIARGPSFTTDL